MNETLDLTLHRVITDKEGCDLNNSWGKNYKIKLAL